MNRLPCLRLATLVAGLTLFGTGCGRSERGPLPTAARASSPPSAPPSGYRFEAPVRLTAQGEPISVDAPGFACPTVADVDGDGADDLVVGCFGSKFFYSENSGGEGVPQLADSSIPLGIDLPGGHAGPHLADWDSDGDLDLLSGSAGGGAYLSENTGSRESPLWSAFRQLVPLVLPQAQPTDGEATIVPSASTRVSTIDWNGDGRLDLLLGDRAAISSGKKGSTDDKRQTGFVWLFVRQPETSPTRSP